VRLDLFHRMGCCSVLLSQLTLMSTLTHVLLLHATPVCPVVITLGTDQSHAVWTFQPPEL
jgi:hypothetical protein